MKASAITTLAAAILAGTAAAANNATTSTSNSTSTSTTTTTSGCWDISVEHDATYCIEGPICSGSGLEPEGSLCPKKGAVATADCHDYLTSYGSDGSCVLPVDSSCQIIKTGAWGCVLSSSGSASGEGATDAGETDSGSGAVNATVLAAQGAASSSTGLPAGAVGAIAAAAGCVAAVAGFTLYKQYQKHSAEAAERARLETFVDVVTP